MSSPELDRVMERQHEALDAFVKGNHEPLADLLSPSEDVTLGNPFGPFVRGRENAVETMARAASLYRDGEATGFDEVSRHLTEELACVVETERFSAKIAGGQELTPLSLRCTSVFRREADGWRLVHRHADPITTPRTAESLIQP